MRINISYLETVTAKINIAVKEKRNLLVCRALGCLALSVLVVLGQLPLAFGFEAHIVGIKAEIEDGIAEYVVINKVYYDVARDKGVDPNNEWVELYNPTDTAVDLANWQICDNYECDTLSAESLEIPAFGFVFITGYNGALLYWNIPEEVPVIMLNSLIGNGLDNDADMLLLKDSQGDIVDQMNWGVPEESWANYNENVWNSGCLDIAEGHTLARVPNGFDTGKPSDFKDLAMPYIEVLSPNGGETWYVGRSYDIMWAATNPNGDDTNLSIDIWYSKDSGSTWANIAQNTENDGTYNWRVPLFIGDYYMPSNKARIKIMATGPENFLVQDWDMSDSDFCPPIDYSLLTSEELAYLQSVGMGPVGDLFGLPASTQEPDILESQPEADLPEAGIIETVTSAAGEVINIPSPQPEIGLPETGIMQTVTSSTEEVTGIPEPITLTTTPSDTETFQGQNKSDPTENPGEKKEEIETIIKEETINLGENENKED